MLVAALLMPALDIDSVGAGVGFDPTDTVPGPVVPTCVWIDSPRFLKAAKYDSLL
jgi:hypothetical protein